MVSSHSYDSNIILCSFQMNLPTLTMPFPSTTNLHGYNQTCHLTSHFSNLKRTSVYWPNEPHEEFSSKCLKIISKLHWHKLQLQRVVLLTMERVLTQFENPFCNEYRIKPLFVNGHLYSLALIISCNRQVRSSIQTITL